MVRDSGLRDLVSQFAVESSSTVRDTLITDIIFQWTGVDGFDPGGLAILMGDNRKLYSMEQFFGQIYNQGGSRYPVSGPAPGILNNAFAGLQTLILGQLNAHHPQRDGGDIRDGYIMVRQVTIS